jgi:hypothetical protein
MIIKRHARRRRWPELDQRIVDDLVNNPLGTGTTVCLRPDGMKEFLMSRRTV